MDSEEPAFGKGHALTGGDDEVIEHPNVHQRQRIPKPSGDRLVRVTRLGNTRRVVVEKDDRGRVDLEGTLHHDAGMYRRAIDGALEHLRHLDDAVPVVEEQRTEHLVLAIDELQAKERPGLLGAAQRTARR